MNKTRKKNPKTINIKMRRAVEGKVGLIKVGVVLTQTYKVTSWHK